MAWALPLPGPRSQEPGAWSWMIENGRVSLLLQGTSGVVRPPHVILNLVAGFSVTGFGVRQVLKTNRFKMMLRCCPGNSNTNPVFFLKVLAQNGTFENRNLNTMRSWFQKIKYSYVHKKSTTKYYGQISRKKKTPKKNISISPTHNMTYLLGMSSSDSDSKTGALNIAPGLWVLDCILPR